MGGVDSNAEVLHLKNMNFATHQNIDAKGTTGQRAKLPIDRWAAQAGHMWYGVVSVAYPSRFLK